jgi:hypothetical protein
MARAGRAGGQHCDEPVATGSCQATFARLVLAYEAAAARADRSRPRHEASETTGQTRAAATTRIIAVKANQVSLWPEADARLVNSSSRKVVREEPWLSAVHR